MVAELVSLMWPSSRVARCHTRGLSLHPLVCVDPETTTLFGKSWINADWMDMRNTGLVAKHSATLTIKQL